MTYLNSGFALWAWITGQSRSFSGVIVDTNGTAHSVLILPFQSSATSTTILFIDTSTQSYTASYVQMSITVGSTTQILYQISVSGTKSANEPLIIAVEITIQNNTNYNFNMFTGALLAMSAGYNPPYSFSASASCTVISYSTSSSGCLSTISSTTTENASSISYGYSGDTLTVTASFSAGSCQQLENPQITFSDNIGDSQTIGFCSTTPCYTAECGYNASCTHTAELAITIS